MRAPTILTWPGRPGTLGKGGSFSAEDVFWLIRLRWYAIAGVLAVITVCFQFRLINTLIQLLLVTGVIAVTNLLLWIFARAEVPRFGQDALERAIVPQLVLDLVGLAMLIHFAGGVENPFVMFFAFHMAIGAMFLRPRLSWAVGLGGGLVHALVVTVEFFEIFPHHHITFAFGSLAHPNLHLMPAFVGGYLVAFLLMAGGVIYFVQTVAERTRRAEAMRQEHERFALSRERLARIGEISAGVAHAIRNPLHGLFNCVTMVRQKATPAEDWVREISDLMAEGLQRIDRATHRLLTLAREIPLRPVSTDLEALSGDVIRFVADRARRREIRLVVALEPIAAIRLDRDRISEVLINLLENALDACSEGGVVTLSGGPVTEPFPAVCLEIADNGVGIAPEVVEKIFDPFFTTKAVGDGSGLGLAIARRVIEEHGGRITVHSRIGQGTSVRIHLPVPTAGAA